MRPLAILSAVGPHFGTGCTQTRVMPTCSAGSGAAVIGQRQMHAAFAGMGNCRPDTVMKWNPARFTRGRLSTSGQ